MKGSVIAILLVVAIVASSVAGYNLASSTITGSSHSPGTISQVTKTVTSTITDYVTNITIVSNTSSSTSCSATGGIGCPHFFDTNWTLSVNYSGPWGANYQGWLGDKTSGQLIVSGSFFGNGADNKTVTVEGWSDYGVTICVQAQKLDSSNAMLNVSILPPHVNNQTSLAFGTAESCVSDVIM